MSNRSYDFLKDVVTVVLPGLAALYATLGGLWNLPHVEPVVGTTAAVVTFLGLFLRVASKRYADQPVEYDGELIAVKLEDNPTDLLLSLDNHEQAEQIRQKEAVTFKVIVR